MATYQVQGRDYLLVKPGGLFATWKARPLMVLLHGGMSNKERILETTGMEALARSERFYLAIPDGTGGALNPDMRTWNAGKCCGGAQKLGVDDVGFLKAVIGDVSARYKVSHVTAVGMSNGGMMAYRVLAEAPWKLRGVGVVAGTLAVDELLPESAGVRVHHIHGLEDANVPFLGGVGPTGMSGVSHRSVPETIGMLLAQRGLTYQGADTYEPFPAQGAPVTLKTHQGGHVWPPWASAELAAATVAP